MPGSDLDGWKADVARAGLHPRRYGWIVSPLRRLFWPVVRPYFFRVLDTMSEVGLAVAPASADAGGRTSYSQSGEDLILEFVLKRMAVADDEVTYADIGAATPDGDSNTYLLYQRGGRGLLVEADPKYRSDYAALRPGDEVLSVAVVPQRLRAGGTIEFHLCEDQGWNSIVREHLDVAKAMGKGGLRETIVAEARTINEVLNGFAERDLHVLSVDVESVDVELMEELDFSRVHPWILVIEDAHRGQERLATLLAERGYERYASTGINSIFLDRDVLERLKKRF